MLSFARWKPSHGDTVVWVGELNGKLGGERLHSIKCDVKLNRRVAMGSVKQAE